ncbi:hypothetical protein SRHO_G00115470 [Serrasalmus rhombeus]
MPDLQLRSINSVFSGSDLLGEFKLTAFCRMKKGAASVGPWLEIPKTNRASGQVFHDTAHKSPGNRVAEPL